MSGLFLRAIAVSLIWFVFMGALIFWPAGTWAFPGGWALIILLVSGGLTITAWLARHSPALLQERLRPPIQRGQHSWDQIWIGLFISAFCIWLAAMGWDAARTGFHAVPAWGQVLGGLAVAASMAGGWWAFRANAFAAAVVKIQENQQVIDTGPYAVVRHPMYASALLLFAGVPLLLGSWLGLVLAPVLIAGMAWRAIREEEALRRDLAGYDGYARRVRYRLFPGIW